MRPFDEGGPHHHPGRDGSDDGVAPALRRAVRAGMAVESLIVDGVVLASGGLPGPSAAVTAVEAALAVPVTGRGRADPADRGGPQVADGPPRPPTPGGSWRDHARGPRAW